MTSLQEYLKRYNSDEKKKKKKRNEKKNKLSSGGTLTIMDADPVWQKELKEESSESEAEQEDAPLVIEDVEFKRMQRLEALRQRPYLGTAADGSGWVSLNDDQEQGPPEEHMAKELMAQNGLHAVSESSSKKTTVISLESQETDLSPPRKRRHSSAELRLPQVNAESEDLSPPRRMSRGARQDSPESTPVSRDLSPPRRESKKGCHDSRAMDLMGTCIGMDLSPPSRDLRSARLSDLRDVSRNRDGDLSPPRRQSRRGHLDSPELLNASPSRKDFRSNQERDLSPPRKHSRRGRHDSPEEMVKSLDVSPPRREHTYAGKADTDISPPRRKNQVGLGAKDLEKCTTRGEVMGAGIAAGLQSGRELTKENNLKKTKESKRVKDLDMSISGHNAITIYRDKLGRRLEGVDAILKLQQAEEPKKEEKRLEWGKGLVQKREAEAQRAELEAESAKPFARTREDLDAVLREQIRWGDPMAHLVKKKVAEPILLDLGANEQMKESGFIIPQEIPAHSWMKRGIAPPPNRYGIKPGRHWDGVDRSTGFERDMYKRQNERKAEQVEAYLWSVADM